MKHKIPFPTKKQRISTIVENLCKVWKPRLISALYYVSRETQGHKKTREQVPGMPDVFYSGRRICFPSVVSILQKKFFVSKFLIKITKIS